MQKKIVSYGKVLQASPIPIRIRIFNQQRYIIFLVSVSTTVKTSLIQREEIVSSRFRKQIHVRTHPKEESSNFRCLVFFHFLVAVHCQPATCFQNRLAKSAAKVAGFSFVFLISIHLFFHGIPSKVTITSQRSINRSFLHQH